MRRPVLHLALLAAVVRVEAVGAQQAADRTVGAGSALGGGRALACEERGLGRLGGRATRSAGLLSSILFRRHGSR